VLYCDRDRALLTRRGEDRPAHLLRAEVPDAGNGGAPASDAAADTVPVVAAESGASLAGSCAGYCPTCARLSATSCRWSPALVAGVTHLEESGREHPWRAAHTTVELPAGELRTPQAPATQAPTASHVTRSRPALRLRTLTPCPEIRPLSKYGTGHTCRPPSRLRSRQTPQDTSVSEGSRTAMSDPRSRCSVVLGAKSEPSRMASRA
jgi:hypothetical protein